MREAYARGATQGELCRRYKMSIGQVGRIVRGESWSQYTNPAAEEESTPQADEDELNQLAAESLRQLQESTSQVILSDTKEDLSEERAAELLRRLQPSTAPAVDLETFVPSETQK